MENPRRDGSAGRPPAGQRAAAARLSANRRYGRQLEGNYRGGRKTAHPAIRYESARAGPIKLYH